MEHDKGSNLVGPLEVDLLIIGAGAAGLWSGIMAARRLRARRPRGLSILVMDGRVKVGAKILMSGGTRCNLTHVRVEAGDYRGGSHQRIARVLRAQQAEESLRIFREELGLEVKSEPNGKLFPADDSARTVLRVLLDGLAREGVPLATGSRLTALAPLDAPSTRGWRVDRASPEGIDLPPIVARRVVVATGGLSFPRSGSDGSLFPILAALGHTIVPPVPALTPLVLRGELHRRLAGLSTPVRLELAEEGRPPLAATGPMLFAHFGVTGPAALDISGPFARARRDRPASRVDVTCSFLPDESAADTEARWLETARRNPRATARSMQLGLPHNLQQALVEAAGLDPGQPLAQTTRDRRGRFIGLLHAFPLDARGVLGFDKAEVTSGGVALEETDSTLQSRVRAGLHFAGEVLDVDGRLGGFNFQWAWSSGALAGIAAVDGLLSEDRP